MENPRATSTGPVTTGARNSLAGDGRFLTDIGPAAQRLHRDPRVRRAVIHLNCLGPRRLGESIAELLDARGIAPEAFDRLLAWQRMDPRVVASVGGDRVPPWPLLAVPR